MTKKQTSAKTARSRVVTASEFKARCLQLMDEVGGGGEIVITKRGKPVSRLVPYRERAKTLFGALAGSVEIRGDVVESLAGDWEADR